MVGGVPSGPAAAGGDSGRVGGVASRSGGVPNLGGAVPKEFDKAAAKADIPGPAPGPGGLAPTPERGVEAPDPSSVRGEMIGPTRGGVPNVCVGSGEANRAVASARG